MQQCTFCKRVSITTLGKEGRYSLDSKIRKFVYRVRSRIREQLVINNLMKAVAIGMLVALTISLVALMVPFYYEKLGIGRLIYQLPTTLCEIFLTEVFKKNTIDALDPDTLFTINKFFENNLNVSETSRKLFVHRNTLVYRLEKIKKLTGLDLRQFDHAIVFKVALMVRKYLSSRDLY